MVVRGEVRQLLTVREVAARLRVSRATVYRLVRAGALPTLRISNSIRVPKEALEQAITSTAGAPLPSAPTLAIRGGRGAHGPSPAAP
ncbi:MAG: helix-turn-helix domain-containing protein [Thermoleophilia bacterium]|nr:helix-turn-helix domain-containing protein [Thermoleophilia bacterium]